MQTKIELESIKNNINKVKELEFEKIKTKEKIQMDTNYLKERGKQGLGSNDRLTMSVEQELKEESEILKIFEVELKQIQEDIINQQKEIGLEINENLESIIEEIKIYNGENKKLNNLILLNEKIKQKTILIEELSEILVLINVYKETPLEDHSEENEVGDLSPLESEEKPNNIVDDYKQNDIAEVYILPRYVEFSRYNLNNKQGYALKNFGIDHKHEINKVLTHFNFDIQKTINYLQKIHGLCPGSKIEHNSFKQCCYELFKRPF